MKAILLNCWVLVLVSGCGTIPGEMAARHEVFCGMPVSGMLERFRDEQPRLAVHILCEKGVSH